MLEKEWMPDIHDMISMTYDFFVLVLLSAHAKRFSLSLKPENVQQNPSKVCIKLVKHGEKSSKTSKKKHMKCVACASTSRNFVPSKTRFAWPHGYTNATFENSEYSLYKRSHQVALGLLVGVRPRNKSPPT